MHISNRQKFILSANFFFSKIRNLPSRQTQKILYKFICNWYTVKLKFDFFVQIVNARASIIKTTSNLNIFF